MRNGGLGRDGWPSVDSLLRAERAENTRLREALEMVVVDAEAQHGQLDFDTVQIVKETLGKCPSPAAATTE